MHGLRSRDRARISGLLWEAFPMLACRAPF